MDMLVLFLTCLFTVALAGQCFFGALLFARLQIKRVALDFLDDVLLLNLPLEAAQRIFQGFSVQSSGYQFPAFHPIEDQVREAHADGNQPK